jgi:dienelactone hydrolase
LYSVTQSLVRFESGGKSITMDCFLPNDQDTKFPAVVGLHGSGGGYPLVAVPGRLLAAHGFAVYVPHYFERTNTTVADYGTALRNFPAWMKAIWDAVSFVVRQPQVSPDRVGMLGFSLGAYLSLSSAGIDDRIKAVVDFFGGLPKEMKLVMRRFCPVLILHGDADTTVPVSEAHHIQQVCEKKNVPYEMKIYPGVGHGFSQEIMQDAGLRTLSFLNKYLAER